MTILQSYVAFHVTMASWPCAKWFPSLAQNRLYSPDFTKRLWVLLFSSLTNHSLALDSFRYDVVANVSSPCYIHIYIHHVLQWWGAWKPAGVQTLETRSVTLVCFTGQDRGGPKTGTGRALKYSCHKTWFCPWGCKNNTNYKTDSLSSGVLAQAIYPSP